MSAINDGGSITPRMVPCADGSVDLVGGLSVRDWFAGMALQGYCSRADLDWQAMESFADHAFRQADSMLAARERKEDAK